jgi:hypothetical protein
VHDHEEEGTVTGVALRVRVIAYVALFILAAAPSALAQSGTSGLRGVVSDAQGAHVPGATITLTGEANGFERIIVSDASGDYQFVAIPPGTYTVKVELPGFSTAVYKGVVLPVDIIAKQDVRIEVGQLSDSVQVTAETTVMNTTDASLGNVITSAQVQALPLEGRNVVGLLSLQAGAVYLPNSSALDNRSGAVSGARADQANITLDGVDVNDPQFNSAYSSALRSTLDSLQEFRVTTSNYGADSGRSSSAQVSLVTKSGTNAYKGSAYTAIRNTATSSNEYFNKLAGLEVPKLDKQIYGGSFGGPLIKDKLFFFANYERLKENSEATAERAVPSASMRDGVLIYQCRNAGDCPASSVRGFANTHSVPAGFYGASPGDLASLDPLGIGPSAEASKYFGQMPLPNDPGRDGYNIMTYRFTAPYTNNYNTAIGRMDFRPTNNQSIFGRFNLQRDTELGLPQYVDLGLKPNTTREVKSWGHAIGYDWVIRPNLISTSRWGFTKIVDDTIGTLDAPLNYFRFIDDLNEGTSSNGRETPTHNFVEDITWLKGSHSIKAGANLRFTRIPSYSNAGSFSSVTANGSWTAGVGRRFIPGRSSCSTPGCAVLPAVASGFNASFADSWIDILGVMSQATGNFNFDRDGNALPEGEAVKRRYASDEYEFYLQDSWKLHDRFTVTGGLRYGLASPPYETNGLQVAPNVSLGAWFAQREQMAKSGIPDNTLPLVSYELSGPKNGKKGYYEWDKNNIAPRVSVAWTPHDKWVIRGGYSLLYDRIGLALAQNFDVNGSYGLSTSIDSAYQGNNEEEPSVRFKGITTLPPTIPTAPTGGFPATPEVDLLTITSSIDDTLKTPYAHSFNLVVGHELSPNWSVEAAYVGRLGRNLLVRRDLAMPLNLVDTQSGSDYYTAATALIKQLEANGFDASSVTPIPYFENMFPDAAGVYHDSATASVAEAYAFYYPDHTSALLDLDLSCDPACSKGGVYSYWNAQYFSLAAQSTLARSEYNALQLTLRKRYSKGYQFDLNYTFGYSEDHGSGIERGSSFTEFDNGGYTGFLINSWDPDQQYAKSDFDIRHQFNANWVAELPFGQGKWIGGNSPAWLNAVIGNWSVAGLFRLTSGLPFNIFNCRSCWATNWNLQGNASFKDPNKLPPTGTTKDVLNGKPSPFSVTPEKVLDYLRFDYPGEGGTRNVLRGDGYFSLDLSVAKSWKMPFGNDHRLWFRWDTFNLTNTPRFDVGNVNMFPDITTTFGTYDGTYATCDGNAGRCMQFSARYEF